jgi:hypothetical protein
MRVQKFYNIEDLPQNYLSLFDDVGRKNFYLSLPWFRNMIRTVRDPGSQTVIYGVADGNPDGAAHAVFMTVERASAGTTPRTLSSFANVYSMVYGPVMNAERPDGTAVVTAWAKAVAAERPRWHAVRLTALDPASAVFDHLRQGLRAAGFAVTAAAEFVNWYEPVEGVSFADYHASLSGKMRSLLRGRTRIANRDHAVRFVLCRGNDGLAEAEAAYAQIYAHSWKQAEPYPGFIPGLIRAAIEMGVLRLGILYIDDVPAAAQIWIVSGGKATIYKIAYDESYKTLSAGSLLTIQIMEALLDSEPLIEVDFGYGDDRYKKDWLRHRRERWVIDAYNPWTLRGGLRGMIHIGGRAIKSRLRPASDSQTVKAG